MSKPKRKLTAAQRRARRERKRKFMTIFINGKQKRVRRPPEIDGLPVEEFIARNADPIWLHQNGYWDLLGNKAWLIDTFVNRVDNQPPTNSGRLAAARTRSTKQVSQPLQTPVSLLERLRREPDEESWRRLDHLYRPLIERWLKLDPSLGHDCEDLVQEVMQVLTFARFPNSSASELAPFAVGCAP